MDGKAPNVILRLGSHSEKEYFDKLIPYLDGYIVQSNLIEATPAASASLVVRFSGTKRKAPFYLDPMTYAFGSYTDPNTGVVRKDLDWIKSNQKRGNRVVRDFKRSYKNLGQKLGGPFATAVDAAKGGAAVSPEVLARTDVANAVCKSVLLYQESRVPEVFVQEAQEMPGADHLAKDLPTPAAVFAPYFYVEPSRKAEWLKTNFVLWKTSTDMQPGYPVHAILCFDESSLLDDGFLDEIVEQAPKTGVAGLWLWISRLKEEEVDWRGTSDLESTWSYRKLMAVRMLTEKLSQGLEVYNMHGGFFSMSLCKSGMKAVSHGVGYGEQKDVVPVIGQALPVVRYYLPGLRRRVGAPDIERCFRSLGIQNPTDFYDKICDCTICRGVVTSSVDQFRLFGEFNPSKPGKKRGTQKPASAKRCRFHFLLRRMMERNWIREASVKDIVDDLESSHETWESQTTTQRYCYHLKVWEKTLS